MLEKGFSTEPTVLIMRDGRTVSINEPDDYLMRLLGVAVDGENVSSEQAAHLDLIRRCTASNEPGGGHMVDLIRACCLVLLEGHRNCGRTGGKRLIRFGARRSSVNSPERICFFNNRVEIAVGNRPAWRSCSA
jgi:hypothetical protein